MKYSFLNDYSEGGHPQVLAALNQTNLVQSVGYGQDEYCLQAKEILKEKMQNKNVDIHFLIGGTQTNMIMIASALKDYQAVIAVDSGHIQVHETGAVESTGHKILTCPHQDGKINVSMIDEIYRQHTDEHMVQPKMVYISQTTEYGTYYTLEELKTIYAYCKEHQLYLFVDGARLGSALVLENAPTLRDLAQYSDAFYIGGTKMGALFGECLVLINDDLKPDFRYHIKQKGAMLAKGRLLGLQFLALFKEDLYYKIGLHENKCAHIIKEGLITNHIPMYIDSPSNQLFPIFEKNIYQRLSQDYAMTEMFNVDEEHICVRLVTSWATPEEICHEFINDLAQL